LCAEARGRDGQEKAFGVADSEIREDGRIHQSGRPELKKNWTPTEDAFQQFLKWLDQGVDSGGEKYLEMRRRLAAYFDRKSCLGADELADDTLSRVAQKLDEKGSITGLSPAHYCYVVAKFVFLEYLRSGERSQVSLEELPGAAQPHSRAPLAAEAMGTSGAEARLECLEHCLNKLTASDRQLILDYYHGEHRAKIEKRSQIALSLGVTMNALSIRACRIRQKLEVCVRRCCAQM
jgi:DNA-directed RNA polymerase specialized sigma24 family protein